jgi:hypothetical protein
LVFQTKGRAWLGVFKNKVLKKIFGPKKGVMPGSWEQMYKEEFHNLHFSSNIRIMILRRMRWSMHVAHLGEIRKLTKF